MEFHKNAKTYNLFKVHNHRQILQMLRLLKRMSNICLIVNLVITNARQKAIKCYYHKLFNTFGLGSYVDNSPYSCIHIKQVLEVYSFIFPWSFYFYNYQFENKIKRQHYFYNHILFYLANIRLLWIKIKKQGCTICYRL